MEVLQNTIVNITQACYNKMDTKRAKNNVTSKKTQEHTQEINVLPTNMHFYKALIYKSINISVYINVKEEQDYYLVLNISKNKYYINMCCLDKIDNIEQFKKVVTEDVCFYKSVVLENYYNIYKNLKVDVYKDIPDEEMDNFDNILPSFNGYYYIKNDMFNKYPHFFCVLPILEKLKGI